MLAKMAACRARQARPVWLLAGALLVAAAATVYTGWRLTLRGAAPRRGADIAVVALIGPNRLAVVDLDALRVVTTVPLRSFVTDIAADHLTGSIVTAQAGGVGDDADDVVGVYDVRRGGEVAYVRLPTRNPATVTARDGRAWIQHGMLDARGLFLSVVDLRSRAVIAEGRTPESTGGSLVASSGALWMLGFGRDAETAAGAEGPPSFVMRLDAVTFEATRVTPALDRANKVLPLDDRRLLVLGGRPDAGPAYAAEYDATSGAAVRRAAFAGLRRGAFIGCVAGGRVAATDWDGTDPAAEGERVAWLDLATLAPGGSIRIPGGPCAIAPWHERFVVVDRAANALLVIDPAMGRVVGRIELPGQAPLAADVEVLQAEGPGPGG
jgi:hypothetical protein